MTGIAGLPSSPVRLDINLRRYDMRTLYRLNTSPQNAKQMFDSKRGRTLQTSQRGG